MLDTNTINRIIKSYIKTLMENMIQNTLKGQLHDMLMIALKENSTIELIRNISLQDPKEGKYFSLNVNVNFILSCFFTSQAWINKCSASSNLKSFPQSRLP